MNTQWYPTLLYKIHLIKNYNNNCINFFNSLIQCGGIQGTKFTTDIINFFVIENNRHNMKIIYI